MIHELKEERNFDVKIAEYIKIHMLRRGINNIEIIIRKIKENMNPVIEAAVNNDNYKLISLERGASNPIKFTDEVYTELRTLLEEYSRLNGETANRRNIRKMVKRILSVAAKTVGKN